MTWSETASAHAASNSEAGLLSYLELLSAEEPADSLLELRYRLPGSAMCQRFHRIDQQQRLAETILVLAPRADVYVGCAPRRERFGGKRAIERVWTLWADCDSADSIVRLAAFAPPPGIVVRSGSGSNRHAYWPLINPLTPDEAEQANRRLARALAADMAATDAARILRPPGSANHKHNPAAPVTLETLRLCNRLTVEEIVGTLADPPRRQAFEADVGDHDTLRDVLPVVYVAALTGRAIGRDGKVSCPLHEDRTPSLHVYAAPEQGWYCYGCGRGGSIYDLAAGLWGLETRGRDFIRLRRRLYELLFPDSTILLQREHERAGEGKR